MNEQDVAGENTVVSCLTCGRNLDVSFAKCLGRGWPTCHGATMRMVSTMADVPAAVRTVMPPLSPRQLMDLARK